MTEMEGIDRTGYTFHVLADEELRDWGIHPLPLPVRAHKEGEVFHDGRARLDLLADELHRFLQGFPELSRNYAPTMELLSLLAAMQKEREGDEHAAARCLEEGLLANPNSLPLRSGYALALHAQGRLEEALEQYQMVLATPEGRLNPMLCLKAARLYTERGDYRNAHALLQDVAGVLPPQHPMRALLAEMGQFLRMGRTREGSAVPPALTTPPVCAACGRVLHKHARFCPGCGRERAAVPPIRSSCPVCGSQTSAGARFCKNCGRPLQPDA